MKILCTGFTARMVGSKKVRYDYLTFSSILFQALRDLGHEVDVCKPEWGDRVFDQYDHVFVGIGLLSSLSSLHPHRAAWTMLMAGDRCTLYCDDWSIEKAGYDINRKLNIEWDKYKKFRSEVGAMDPDSQEIMRDTLGVLVDRTRGQYTMLAPMFPWGDHSKLLGEKVKLNVNLVAVDPSPYVSVPTPNRSFPKLRQWSLATLQDHDSWLKKLHCSWPVVEKGNKRKDQSVDSEASIIDGYNHSWGVLCPRYQTVGSGWWRARYNYAAAVGSILYCDPRDGQDIGTSYTQSIFNIEHCNDTELSWRADRQREEFTSKLWSKEKFLQSIAEVLK